MERAVRTRKLAGLAFVALPLAVFTLFAVGEVVALETGWWIHLLQMAAIALLLALAWSRPHVGGPVLTVVGLVLSALLIAGVRDDLMSRLMTVGLLFAPLIVGGIAFTLAGARGRVTSAVSGRRRT